MLEEISPIRFSVQPPSAAKQKASALQERRPLRVWRFRRRLQVDVHKMCVKLQGQSSRWWCCLFPAVTPESSWWFWSLNRSDTAWLTETGSSFWSWRPPARLREDDRGGAANISVGGFVSEVSGLAVRRRVCAEAKLPIKPVQARCRRGHGQRGPPPRRVHTFCNQASSLSIRLKNRAESHNTVSWNPNTPVLFRWCCYIHLPTVQTAKEKQNTLTFHKLQPAIVLMEKWHSSWIVNSW